MGLLQTTLHMSVEVEQHARVGFRRAQTTFKVQVPLEERSVASKVDVQVQIEGNLIFGSGLSDLYVIRLRLRGCHRTCCRGHLSNPAK
jgi:hypothetical protein